ncbi:MAG TPA: hypothetical protein PK364_12275 [Synergistaceae bacterium]|nr:hypothetical protein [Synergistaceae bacterium]
MLSNKPKDVVDAIHAGDSYRALEELFAYLEDSIWEFDKLVSEVEIMKSQIREGSCNYTPSEGLGKALMLMQGELEDRKYDLKEAKKRLW